MNWLERFLIWSRENKAKFIGIAIVSHGVILVYAITTLNYFLLVKDSSSPNLSISHSGAERLYPIVREGDDKFAIGEHSDAWKKYEYAKDALRSLQAEYPERSQRYRDAERVVQSRMYLAQSAAYIEEILPNKQVNKDASR